MEMAQRELGLAGEAMVGASGRGPVGGNASGGETRSCQSVSEPKAFTGRGGGDGGVDAPPTEERRLLAALDRAHRAQRQLVEQTKRVAGRRFYLALHKRDSGARFVRWRDTGREGSNVPWYEVPEFIKREPASLHDWYRRINEHALRLNDEEQLRRTELTLFARRQARLRGDDSLEPSGARRRGGGDAGNRR